MMVEGNTIHAIVRMTGASKNTIVKLVENVGKLGCQRETSAPKSTKALLTHRFPSLYPC
jgi:hypothetical protein